MDVLKICPEINMQTIYITISELFLLFYNYLFH